MRLGEGIYRKENMKNLLLFVLALVGALQLYAVQAISRDRTPEDVVATVDGEKITHGEIMQGVQMNLMQMSQRVPASQLDQMREQIYQNVMDTLIANILLTKAAEKSSLTVSDEELAREIETIEGNAPEGTSLRNALAENNIDYEKWSADMRKQLLVRKLVEQVTNSQPNDGKQVTLLAYIDELKKTSVIERPYTLREQAEQGDVDAQWSLGEMYYKGQGVPHDNIEAVKWLGFAAQQGHANAQNLLGMAYYRGDGVRQDNETAAKWVRMAADQGHAMAQSNLGEFYSKGIGVPQDMSEAIRWWKLSAAQGNGNAEYSLSHLNLPAAGTQEYNTSVGVNDTQPAASSLPRSPIAESSLKLPEYFGIYAVQQNGDVITIDRPVERLDEIPKLRLSGDVEFLVYGNNVDPSAIRLIILPAVQPQRRKQGEKPFSWDDWMQDAMDTSVMTGIPKGSREGKLLVKPVSNQPQMLRFIPVGNLPAGMYQISAPNEVWYRFMVGR